MTIFRFSVALILAGPGESVPAQPLVSPAAIRKMVAAADKGKSLDVFVKKHAHQRAQLIDDFRSAGFEHRRRKDCDHLYGGYPDGSPGRGQGQGWHAFIWLCSDTSGAKAEWGASL